MRYLLGMMLTLSFVGIAFAGDMSDSENLDFGQKTTDDRAATVSQRCGATITGKIDRPSFKGDAESASSQLCAQAVDGVGGLCDAMPDHKKDIVKAVKTVTCHYDAKQTDNHGVRVSKKGTNVDVFYNKDGANFADSVTTYLKKTL
jgi:hypothetical protein